MAKRLSHEEAAALMRAAGLEPLEEYPGALAKWRCRCVICGSVVQTKYNTVQSRGAGCRPCANRKKSEKSRMSSAEVAEKLLTKNLVLLGDYVNADSPVLCLCKICSKECLVRMSHFNRMVACPTCAKKIGGQKSRLSHDEANQTPVALDIEPMEPYITSTSPWKMKCLRCGEEYVNSYQEVRAGKRGCIRCAKSSRRAKRMLNPEVATLAMRDAGLEPLEPYTNLQTPWRSKCLKCGRESSPRLANVRCNEGGCRYCATNAPVDPQRAVLVMRNASLEPLEPFTNAVAPWKSKCLRCGKTVFPKFSKVQDGQSGCRDCGYKVMADKHRLDPAIAEQIMLDAGLEPLVPYEGDGVKWKSRCLSCGKVVFPMLTNIKQGNGGCLYCARRGIDFNLPAYLYFIHHHELSAHKVGVGNSGERKNDRIRRFLKYGWVLIHRWDFPTGAEAYFYEQLVLTHIRKERGLPPFVTADLMLDTGGHSETFSGDSLTFLEVQELVKGIIKSERFPNH